MGRDLRRSLVQPLAQSTVRPSWKDFTQLGLESLQGWRRHTSLGDSFRCWTGQCFTSGVWDNGVRTLEVTCSQTVALIATNEAHGLIPTETTGVN